MVSANLKGITEVQQKYFDLIEYYSKRIRSKSMQVLRIIICSCKIYNGYN